MTGGLFASVCLQNVLAVNRQTAFWALCELSAMFQPYDSIN